MAAERFPIEAGHIMMFARSVGDPNPVYYDEGRARSTEVGRIIAPPTFVQASAQFDPDYPLRPKIGQPWFGSGKEASGMAGRGGEQRAGRHSARLRSDRRTLPRGWLPLTGYPQARPLVPRRRPVGDSRGGPKTGSN